MHSLHRFIVFTAVVALVAASSSSESSSSESSESSSSSSKRSSYDSSSSSGAKNREGNVGSDGYRTECGGKGTQYCKSPWVYECPPACLRQCDDDYSSGDADSESEWDSMRPQLQLALKMRAFDQVFIHEGKLCVANCKRDPKDLGCHRWTDYMDDKYCVALDCRGTIDGCHTGSDFSKLTCKACRMAFPRCRLV